MRYLGILISLAMLTLSNSVYSMCEVVPTPCDTNLDSTVDESDINEIILAKGTTVVPGDIQFDPDGDGVVTTLDARECADLCNNGICDVPKLLGPIPELPGDVMKIGTGPELSMFGYQRKEYIIADIARSYGAASYPSNGEVAATAAPEDVDGDYNTRVVAITPTDPTDFNGTVVIEWFNVTSGADAAVDWIVAHNEFIRQGNAWVGVSAQAVGVNFLNSICGSCGDRYTSLIHPGDSYSYDIFSLVGRLAGEPNSTLIDGLTADVVLAIGQSQSASRLVTYINAIQPVEGVYDGFLVHSRGSRGSSLRQSPLPSISAPSPTLIREDAALTVPVIVVEAQGDMVNNNFSIRQADTPKFRLWEMAGTSHTDAYTFIGAGDIDDGVSTARMFDALSDPTTPLGCHNVNAGPAHWIVQAAFRGLDTWVRTSVAPASGLPLDTTGGNLDRDVDGNALGGVRSPHVDVPLATLDHQAVSSSGFCGFFGNTEPLTTVRIGQLYPTKADFTQQWSNAVDNSVAAGFLLQVDGDDLKAAAAGAAWPLPPWPPLP